jgi:hypothetical protein
MALGSLHHINYRFNRDLVLTKDYRDLMKTYKSVGHIERDPLDGRFPTTSWYISHRKMLSTTANKWQRLNIKFGLYLTPRGGHTKDIALMISYC